MFLKIIFGNMKNNINQQPIIFIDIDSVLVTTRQHFSKKLHPKYMTCPFDSKCVKVLNEIIEKTNPIIILSSDWKLNFKLAELNEIFNDNGVNSIITDITPDFWGTQFKSIQEIDTCRGFEILKYVHQRQIEKYVAVDDLDLRPWLVDHFVRCTHATEGIKQSGVKEKILKILI
jgi:hypothetical protein